MSGARWISYEIASRVGTEMTVLIGLAPNEIERICVKAIHEVGDQIGSGNALSGCRIHLNNQVLICTERQTVGIKIVCALKGHIDAAVRSHCGTGELVLITGSAALRAEAEGC